MPRPPDPEVWDAVDWTKPTLVIATEIGVTESAVRQQRVKRGRPAPKHTARRPEMWDAVDWTKPTSVLAQELGVHPRTVQTQRRRHGAPPQPAPRRPPSLLPHGAAWSDGAREEVRKTLELNDGMAASGMHVPARKMVDRLHHRWDVETDEGELDRYCRLVLRRKSWRTK